MDKKKHERYVFLRFLEYRNMEFDSADFKSGDPDVNEPDIFYKEVYFEITRACSQSEMELYAKALRDGMASGRSGGGEHREQLTRKIGKEYDTHGFPLELLMSWDAVGNTQSVDQIAMQLCDHIEKINQPIQFRRIWLVGEKAACTEQESPIHCLYG